MLPQLSFERGYCRPDCVKCSLVCPTGAIKPITVGEKTTIQIGYAVLIKEICVINTDNVNCDLCAEVCPTGAIFMIPQIHDDPNSPKIPPIDRHMCIGCGACEHYCPTRPYSAIYVEGIDTHREI
jgi:formate hydrogenlyase subunit 6/NADH:ubiquinone oxidoreductase subunit I